MKGSGRTALTYAQCLGITAVVCTAGALACGWVGKHPSLASTLEGRVLDGGSPVAGAKVFALGTCSTTATAEDGSYHLAVPLLLAHDDLEVWVTPPAGREPESWRGLVRIEVPFGKFVHRTVDLELAGR